VAQHRDRHGYRNQRDHGEEDDREAVVLDRSAEPGDRDERDGHRRGQQQPQQLPAHLFGAAPVAHHEHDQRGQVGRAQHDL